MFSSRWKRGASAVAITASLALALAACTSNTPDKTTSSGSLTTLKVATIGLTSDGSLINGINKGFFEKNGLKIETSVVANPPAGLAAVQSGQVDIAYTPSIPLLNALANGVSVKVIGAADGFSSADVAAKDPGEFDDTGLFASPKSGVTSVKELAGKTIAVPARNAQMEVVISDVLKRSGVDPKGINWVILDFTSAVAALKNGTVAAAGLVNPFTSEAENAGATKLSSPSIAFFGEGAVGLWVTGSNTLTSNKAHIVAFQKALKESNAYANAHPKEAIKAGLAYTKSILTVDQVAVPYWPAEVKQSNLSNVNQKLVDLGFLKSLVNLNGVIFKG